MLQHLTVTGGRTTGDDGGGGILAGDYTTLMLDHATVSGNSTAGIRSRRRDLRLFRDADQQHGQRQQHGGIAWRVGRRRQISGNAATAGYGTVTLTNSTVSGNTAGHRGGGISATP